MNSSTRRTWRTVGVAARSLLALTLLLGVVYPLVVTGLAQVLMAPQANGSALTGRDGRVVGSSLIGQSFSDASGAPLPGFFQPRPSAAGDGYDASASSGSNAGPENPDLIAAIAERRAQVAAFNGVPEAAVPADAVTASGSGLDPHISPAYAELQVARVAAARALPEAEVRAMVEASTQGRDAGYLGEPRVNVVVLNNLLQLEG